MLLAVVRGILVVDPDGDLVEADSNSRKGQDMDLRPWTICLDTVELYRDCAIQIQSCPRLRLCIGHDDVLEFRATVCASSLRQSRDWMYVLWTLRLAGTHM